MTFYLAWTVHLRLAKLLEALPPGPPVGPVDVEVTGISYDSRTILPGNLFVAIGGFHIDGARFVKQALERGAAAAVVGVDARSQLADIHDRLIVVQDPRAALASLAAAWYDHPARELRTIGITGTDGKTSTSYLTNAVLEGGGLRTGLFTTVAYKVGASWEENDSRQTTPEATTVQGLMRRMLDAGCTHAVLESTSHGLELHKLDHCEYDIAVFTNLTADHLDFHRTLGAYRDAKAKLFEMLDRSVARGVAKTAILNADDGSSGYMASRTRARRLWYGIEAPADVRATALSPNASSTRMLLETPAGSAELTLPLPGRFNVYNALAAISIGLTVGVPLDRILEALSAASGVPGRMQPVDEGQPFTVIVDYAHTAASFDKVLATLRPLVSGRIITVFGCAGERGAERRTGMGRVAAGAAGYTIITSEDPRLEEPDSIIAEIAAAMIEHGAVEQRDFARITDRREAIARAFSLARAGDLVLLTGKGHEHSIETARGPIPWDEVAVARGLLASFGYFEMPAC